MSAQVSEPAKAQAGESERRLRLPVFRAAQRHWTVGGVLAIAPLVLRERKSESPAVGIAQAADDAAVDAAVQAFRYARGLVSAQDCLAWLAARAPSFADLRSTAPWRCARAE